MIRRPEIGVVDCVVGHGLIGHDLVGYGAGSRRALALAWAQAQTNANEFTLTEIITAVSIALTIALLVFTLWKGLKRARLRPLLDVARVVLQAATAVAIPLITGVTTAAGLVLASLAIGLVLGLLQGGRLELEVDDDRLYATRSSVGFAIWGIGLVLMQGAGLANRTGLVEIGQAVTWLSIGITAGLILGRHGKVTATVQAAALRATPALVLVVALLGACVDAAEVDTTIGPDGAGAFEIALGVEPDPEESFDCEADEDSAGAYSYADNRGQGLQWCVIGFTFASLEQLADIYVSLDEGQGFITVDCLAFVDDYVVYKIAVQIEDNEEGDVVPWRVTIPGPINSSNASEVNGSTATWFLGSALGRVVLDINVGDEGDCPTEPVILRLAANADGSGVATLRVPSLATGEADNVILLDDLAAAGWPIDSSAGGSASISTRTWTSPGDLAALIAALPLLEGSEIDLVPNAASGETDFNAFIDLSFYENYWQGINPTLADPSFRLVYEPADGVLVSSGDWTNEQALAFDWTVASDGRIFNLFATTGPGGDAAVDAGGVDETPTYEGADDTSGDSTTDGNGADSTTDEGASGSGDAPAPGTPPDLTEAEAAQALLDLLDSQEVSENEALATALAGLAAAAAAGIITMAEAARVAQELAEAAARNRSERPAASADPTPSPDARPTAQAGTERTGLPPRPPGPLRQMTPEQLRQALPHMSRQELDRLVDTLQEQIDTDYGRYVPPLLDDTLDLDGIRERIANGTLTPEDLNTLVRAQDFTGTAHQASNTMDAFHAQRAATATRIGEGFVEGTMMTAKAAASTAAGPVGGALMTAAVDTVAARNLGWGRAVEIGVFHAVADLGQGKFAQAISALPGAQRISGGALSGGFSAFAQNLHDQLATNGGDIDAIDWDQANNAGLLGMGFGGAGSIDGAPPKTPTIPGRPQGFSSDLGDGFSTGRPNIPDGPGAPTSPTSAPDVATSTPRPDLDAPSPTMQADAPTTGSASPDSPPPTTQADPPTSGSTTPDSPPPTTQADPPTSGSTTPDSPPPTTQADPPTTGTTTPDATTQLDQPTTNPDATTQLDQPTTNPDATAQIDRPAGGDADAARTAQDHMSVRPEPSPNADLPPGQATNPETQQILDNLESSPRASADAGGPGRPARPSDVDHEGNVWVGGRRIGTMNSDGQLVDANGRPIRVAHDLTSGASVGYVEVDTSGLPGRPVYNSAGVEVGRVSRSGHIVNPDGSIQMHDGAPARAAIDADGSLVPYEGPDLADVRTEYDQTYSGRRVEHPNPERTPVPDLHELAPETRVPVLDRDGNPSHMVEAVPREVHFDENGQPQFVQHRFPARAQTMDDVNLPGHTNPRFDESQGQLSMPTPDNWGSTTTRTPLTGADAPASAPVVRADSSGATPTGYAATTWDAVGANADGVAVSPSGTPVVRVDAGGNFFDLSGNPVSNVAARDGRVIGFTDSGGQRWIVDDGPSS